MKDTNARRFEWGFLLYQAHYGGAEAQKDAKQEIKRTLGSL